MSTPILNPPQTGILGMHNIQERPVAIDGEVEIRPMMYLALSYDHRIVDGREAVSFLVRVKEAIEDPARLILDLVRHSSLARNSVPSARESLPGQPPTDSEAVMTSLLRPHRHRRRSRRLRLRDSRGAARPEGRARREARHPRRHLPQRRLHPLEGAAALLRALRRVVHSPAHMGIKVSSVEARPPGMLKPQGRGRRRQRQGHRLPASRRTRSPSSGTAESPPPGRSSAGDDGKPKTRPKTSSSPPAPPSRAAR